MNHIYRLKFDRRRNEVVVVSEITTGTGKTRTTGHVKNSGNGKGGLRTLTFSLLAGAVMMATPAMAAGLPTGGQIVAGSGSIETPSSTQMNVYQTSQNMVADWTTFDIAQGNTVQFYQPDSSAVALNRVTGGTESRIMGTLTANGQVFLINPNGVLFGENASVNTAGFVASTKDIRNEDFMNRTYTFSGGSASGAEIVNQGNLTTSAGGYIVLAADRVKNSGTVSTPGGKTVLAAADTVTLTLDNGGLTSVDVNGDVVNALVENQGLVSASGGSVLLTARGRDMLLDTVLNVSGVVEAKGVSTDGGSIVLDGGDSGVVQVSGTLTTDSASGQGGQVVVQGDKIRLDSGSRISATGTTGGGEVYVGGGWQGNNSTIRNASMVVMQEGATINASASDIGNGGTVVLWSDDYTSFQGNITACGGVNGGDGGQVETSSHGTLLAYGSVDASAAQGDSGNWLLDPSDITIISSGNSSAITETNDTADNLTTFTPTASTSQVLNTTINNELNNGTSVTILTNGTATDSAASGNITVSADITKTTGGNASLTLQADGNITVNNNITSTNGTLNVTLLAAGSNHGIITVNGSNISSNGGDITLGQTDTGNGEYAQTVKVVNSTLNASTTNNSTAGNISISASNPNIDLTTDELKTVVRNGNAMIEVNNSNLSGSEITLNTTQNGTNSTGLPVYLTGANLNATGNITLTGNADESSGSRYIELRGNNTLVSMQNNISITNTVTGNGNASAIFLNGSNNTIKLTASNGSISITANNGVNNISNTTLWAKYNITLNGASVNLNNNSCVTAQSGNIGVKGKNNISISGVSLNNVNITASNGSVSLEGTSLNNMAVSVNNSKIIAKEIMLNGTASKNSMGVYLNNTTVNSTNFVNISGVSSGCGTGVLIGGNSSLESLNSSIVINGTSDSGTGLNITSATLNASCASLTGVAMTSGTGFILENLTMNGSLGNWNNVSLGSAGSSTTAVNYINQGVLNTSDALKNVLLNGTDNSTWLNVTGISEYANGTNISNIAQLINSSQTSDDSNLTINLRTNNRSGDWGFTNLLDINASGNITLTGVLVGSANVTSTCGSINITSNTQNLSNNNLSSAGNITLNTTALTLNNTTVTSSNGSVSFDSQNGTQSLANASLNASGNVILNGAAIRLSGTSVNSTTSDINITACSSANVTGVLLNNITLTASAGNISVNGTSNANRGSSSATLGAVSLVGTNNLTAKNINITAINNGTDKRNYALNINKGVHTFNGNTTLNGTSNGSAAVVFGMVNSTTNNNSVVLNFVNGTSSINAVNNGNTGDEDIYSSALLFDAIGNASTQGTINLDNSDLSINAYSENSSGFMGWLNNAKSINSGLNVSGTGSFSINASGGKSGIRGIYLNIDINGSVDITGSSSGSGYGVLIYGNLTDVNIRGYSENGTGVSIGNGTIVDSVICGSAVNGTGVIINNAVLNNLTVYATNDRTINNSIIRGPVIWNPWTSDDSGQNVPDIPAGTRSYYSSWDPVPGIYSTTGLTVTGMSGFINPTEMQTVIFCTSEKNDYDNDRKEESACSQIPVKVSGKIPTIP